MIVVCGGDWQEPHTVIIRHIGDDIVVEKFFESKFVEGLDYDMVEELFNASLPRKVNLPELQRKLDEAVKLEDYEKAAKFRDKINKQTAE